MQVLFLYNLYILCIWLPIFLIQFTKTSCWIWFQVVVSATLEIEIRDLLLHYWHLVIVSAFEFWNFFYRLGSSKKNLSPPCKKWVNYLLVTVESFCTLMGVFSNYTCCGKKKFTSQHRYCNKKVFSNYTRCCTERFTPLLVSRLFNEQHYRLHFLKCCLF